MILSTVGLKVGLGVLAMLGVATVTIIGPARVVALRGHVRERIREVYPFFLALIGVLLVNHVTRRVGTDLSWMIGWNLTGAIYDIEGTFVALLQSAATPLLTDFFSFIYVYGYSFVLIFPLLLYFTLDEAQYIRQTCLAYVFNYGIGVFLYVAIVAYGPRNLMPDLVEPLLYTNWPESKLLTSRVNTNTNVFPSLHTSLSITVAYFAYRTRNISQEWLWLGLIMAGSIVLSTMYLGIHWLTDVIAGTGVAALAIYLAVLVDKGSFWLVLRPRRSSES